MRRCVILLWILAVLTVPVLALDVLEEERQILNVDTLTDGLPDDAQDALRTYSPAARTDPGEAILAIIKWASGLSVSTVREAVQTASLLLTAALVCQLVRQSVPDDRLHIQAMTGALAITLLFATNMKSMLGLAASVLDEMEAYSKLLLPVMCGAAAASGSLTGAGSLYMASSLFFSLLTSLVRSLLVPLVYAFIGLAAAECALPGGKLASVRRLVGWCITVLLKGVICVHGVSVPDGSAVRQQRRCGNKRGKIYAVCRDPGRRRYCVRCVRGRAAKREAAARDSRDLRHSGGARAGAGPVFQDHDLLSDHEADGGDRRLRGREGARRPDRRAEQRYGLRARHDRERCADAPVQHVLLYEGGIRMMEVVRGYLLRLTAGAFLSAGLLALIPKGTSKKAAAVLCGLVMLLLALTPLAQLDYDALSEAISRLELEKEEARTGIEIRNQELVARIISGRVQAYILDKAASLGLTVTVELEMETRAATPYPKAVTIHGEATPAQKQQLQQYLEQTFAIPVQRQVWTP